MCVVCLPVLFICLSKNQIQSVGQNTLVTELYFPPEAPSGGSVRLYILLSVGGKDVYIRNSVMDGSSALFWPPEGMSYKIVSVCL